MEKKPWRKRINRGFWVSIILLAAVLVYVLVTQLMVLPDKREVRKLANAVLDQSLQLSMLSEAQIQALQGKDAQTAKHGQVEQGLKPLFVENSDYLSETADSLFTYVLAQVGGEERVTAQTKVSAHQTKCVVDDNVASVTMEYRVRVSGTFPDYSSGADAGAMKNVSEEYQTWTVGLTCQKVNGAWRIYRLSWLSTRNEWEEGNAWRKY